MKTNDMMVWTWAGWEPLQFYRRLGGFHEAQEGNALWSEDWFRALESEETAKALNEAGINWVTTHFFKGFGLKSEESEIAATERMIRNYHKNGVKVFTYIQYGTVMPETITGENQQARAWGRTDWNGGHDGHPYEYGDQYWRAKPCANQPGFRKYILSCVDRAIGIGADGIWIDNLQSDGCYCPCCQKAFREFVKKTVKDPCRDLGLRPAGLKGIAIPRAVRPRDPLFQLWIRFRVAEVRKSLEMICARARSRKSDVVMAANIGIGNHQRHVLENANWHAMLELLDYTYAENGLFPQCDGGKIVSQHYSMTIGNAAGVKIVPGAGVGADSRGLPRPAVPRGKALRRSFAESFMFGDHAFGGPWGLRGENGGGKTIIARDASWRREHRALVDHYADLKGKTGKTAEAAPVGILYNFESLMSDEGDYRTVYEKMMQVLTQHQIPFRLVLSDRLKVLDEIDVLILPQVLPLSEEAEAGIRKWVRKGGKILATGRCGLYDSWMRQRRDYAFSDLFGDHFTNLFEDGNHDKIIRNPESGCVLMPGRWGINMANGKAACAVTESQLINEIRAMLPKTVPQVTCKSRTVGASWSRCGNGSMMLGLLNYGDTPTMVQIRHGRKMRLIKLDVEAYEFF